MSKPLVSDELWAIIAPLLPPEGPRPRGGRPRGICDRAALAGILFVLKSGIPWEMLPQELGCGSGMTCWRPLRNWQQAGGWQRLHAILPLRQPGKRRGRPRKRPVKLHADKGYDYPRCRQALRARGIIPRIARRGIESSERLGRYRWVVERTLSWLNRFRRLKVRYERRADIHQAFLSLGCALVYFRMLQAA